MARGRRCRDNRPIATDPAPQPPTRSRSPLARLARRGLDWLLPQENPTAAVYGVIVIGALLSAETPSRETYPETIAAACLAAALYWLAHSYARLLGKRLRGEERLTIGSLGRALREDGPLLRGASIPLLALVASALAGASRGTAVSAAVWSSVASLAGFEVVAALRSRARSGELAIEVSIGLTMGLSILALKVILH